MAKKSSGARARARARYQRLEDERERLLAALPAAIEADSQSARAGPPEPQPDKSDDGETAKILCRLHDLGVLLHPLVDLLGPTGDPDTRDGAEDAGMASALIAQIIAPRLAGKTPGPVLVRRELPERGPRK